MSRWSYSGSGVPPLRPAMPEVPLFHVPGLRGPDAVRSLRSGEWEHLGLRRAIGRDRPEWGLGPLAENRLWTLELLGHHWAYSLAEAADLGGPGTEEAEEEFDHYVSDWIQRCGLEAPGALVLAWNSFVLATRIANWVRAYRILGEERLARRPALRDAMLRRLWQEAKYLHGHVEWDLRANHLFRDAVGLAWAGRFFDGAEPRRWTATARRLTLAQIDEQILPDGGHFERSTMYQLQMLEEILSLAILLEDSDAKRATMDAWQRMAEFLAWMRHPDGQIALFNDATLNFHGHPARLLDRGGAFGRPVSSERRRGAIHFVHTGYAVYQGERWSLFVDVGPVGPDCQPGHAHADTLSLECSSGRERLIVDPGTHGYDLDSRRAYDRSTTAHNTVAVDGQDSSEVWHIFRTGRRARPVDVEVAADSRLEVTASHDGYDHLPGRPRHRRRLRAGDAGAIEIDDEVSGRGRHRVSGGYLLAPGWSAGPCGSGWTLRGHGQSIGVTIEGGPGVQLAAVPRPYHPDFGVEIDTTRLEWSADADLPIRVRTRIDAAR